MSMAAPLPERSESPSSHARSWPRPPLSRRRRLGERDCARRDGDSLSGATKPHPVWEQGSAATSADTRNAERHPRSSNKRVLSEVGPGRDDPLDVKAAV
jgi:hypothetical protein